MIGERILSEKEFYNFVLNEYAPSDFEKRELSDARFKSGTNASHVGKTRCFLVYREIVEKLSAGAKIADLGFYPGTLIRELKTLLKEDILCWGIGNKFRGQGFEFMKPYTQACYEVELDPFYCRDEKKIVIPVESNSMDAVVATELLEHLISPLETISEGARILKKGGIFIITTPNVSHIGAVIKLITGKSNYERLERSPMFLQDDPWRGHIRYYDKDELKKLFQNSGLRMVKHKYFQERGWEYANWPLSKRFINKIAGSIVAAYRSNHFAVFQK